MDTCGTWASLWEALRGNMKYKQAQCFNIVISCHLCCHQTSANPTYEIYFYSALKFFYRIPLKVEALPGELVFVAVRGGSGSESKQGAKEIDPRCIRVPVNSSLLLCTAQSDFIKLNDYN